MKKLERIIKGLANGRRLEILNYLRKEKEAPVGDIARAIKLSIKSTSKHLGILAAVDIVEKEKRSLLVFYKISDNLPIFIKNILSAL